MTDTHPFDFETDALRPFYSVADHVLTTTWRGIADRERKFLSYHDMAELDPGTRVVPMSDPEPFVHWRMNPEVAAADQAEFDTLDDFRREFFEAFMGRKADRSKEMVEKIALACGTMAAHEEAYIAHLFADHTPAVVMPPPQTDQSLAGWTARLAAFTGKPAKALAGMKATQVLIDDIDFPCLDTLARLNLHDDKLSANQLRSVVSSTETVMGTLNYNQQRDYPPPLETNRKARRTENAKHRRTLRQHNNQR
jgi:hypothetical protein